MEDTIEKIVRDACSTGAVSLKAEMRQRIRAICRKAVIMAFKKNQTIRKKSYVNNKRRQTGI